MDFWNCSLLSAQRAMPLKLFCSSFLIVWSNVDHKLSEWLLLHASIKVQSSSLTFSLSRLPGNLYLHRDRVSYQCIAMWQESGSLFLGRNGASGTVEVSLLFPLENREEEVEEEDTCAQMSFKMLLFSHFVDIYGELVAHWWPCFLLHDEKQEERSEKESRGENFFRRSRALSVVSHVDLPAQALQSLQRIKSL